MKMKPTKIITSRSNLLNLRGRFTAANWGFGGCWGICWLGSISHEELVVVVGCLDTVTIAVKGGYGFLNYFIFYYYIFFNKGNIKNKLD